MKIKNLSQLKRIFATGAEFRIIEHYVRPECNGQVRKINKTQTNGFYSVVKDNPENKYSRANHGLGSWCEYGKASEWTFVEHADKSYTCILAGTFEIEVLG